MVVSLKNRHRYRILFFSAGVYNFFFQDTARRFGGSSRIYRIVKKLCCISAYEIYCLAGHKGQKTIERKDGVSFIKSRIGQRFGLIDAYLLPLRYKPDLIVEFYASLQVFVLGVLKKFHKFRFIFFVGNDSDVNGLFVKRSNWLFDKFYHWGLCQADRIICQTTEQKQMLKETYNLHSDVVLSPYIEISVPLNQKKKNILWVGRFADQKNPHYYLDIAEELPEESFVMVCNPPSVISKDVSYEKLKDRAKMIKNIEFHESVPYDQINHFFSHAKYLVNTSDFEGFPNTFIEAAHEKVPVVSLVVDPNFMISRHGAGVCCNGDLQKLIATCKKISNDRVILEKMGQKARLYAICNHDIEKSISKIFTIFQEVLAQV